MTEVVTVDARGLACPQPVLETKRVLDEAAADCVTVLVDNMTSRENVSRFARNHGCEVDVIELGSDVHEIRIRRSGPAPGPDDREGLLPCPVPEPGRQVRNVVYVGTDCMGKGDEGLGRKLMRGFLRTWIDVEPKPWRMIFINSGVRLTTIDDEAVEAVAMLAEKGVDVLSCGTCLQFFGLEDQLKVGSATNMFEVIETLNAADKVVSPD